MGQRDVSDEEIREAEAKARARLEAEPNSVGVALERVLKDGRVLYLYYQGRGMSIGISRNASDLTFEATYDYFHAKWYGWRAALGWDGEGEPEDWCRARRDGDSAYRRRPEGDPARECVAP